MGGIIPWQKPQTDLVTLSDLAIQYCWLLLLFEVINLLFVVNHRWPSHNFTDQQEKKKCFDHRQQVGDDLTVICEVRGGSPRPSVTWGREGSIYDSSYELSDYDTVTNTLTYPGLVREDLGTKFVCQASNTNSTPPVSQEVHISLNCKLILEFGSIALCYHG